MSAAAQLACLLEASAPKPGNVSPGRHFIDTHYEHFLASAVAIGPVMARAGELAVGATVLAAVMATTRWAPANTNLGIALLFAPLARTALTAGGTESVQSFRRRLDTVLGATTIQDARDVYSAIRLARPGGLGRVSAQDVADEPTLPLQQVMAMAADRDAVAREYSSNFERTFDEGLPALLRARADGLGWADAIVEADLLLLAARPDTLITRKQGAPAAAAVSQQAAAVVAAGGVRTAVGRSKLDELDRSLRDAKNSGNPGATADLIAASLFVVLLIGGWGSDTP